MMLVAGIDGGQSSTTAVVLDGDGVELGRGFAGPSDHVDEPGDSRRCADALESSLAAALAAAGLPPETQLDAIVAGISGYEGVLHGVPPVLPSANVRLMHDAPIALAGAVGRRPGVVVIAGTGSVAYGEDRSGASVRVGGWGYLFGDAGSSYALARDALAYAMAESDCGVTSDLGAAACAFFDVPSLRALVHACTTHEIGRPQLAGFARVVVDAARLGKTEAATLVDNAASALAALAALAIERLQLGGSEVPVAFTGGLASAGDMPVRLAEKMAALVPTAQVMEPRNDPAVGAALLALAEAGSVARST
jgi:N-acetylglucosamine kinase-like BadF-type ATPase